MGTEISLFEVLDPAKTFDVRCILTSNVLAIESISNFHLENFVICPKQVQKKYTLHTIEYF